MTQDDENLKRSFVRIKEPLTINDDGFEKMMKHPRARIFQTEEDLNAYLKQQERELAQEPLYEMKILKDFFKRCKKSTDIIPEWNRCGGLERRFLIKAMERLISMKKTKGRI
jgi:hypothetical protein